jgi:hypothetical protein
VNVNMISRSRNNLVVVEHRLYILLF